MNANENSCSVTRRILYIAVIIVVLAVAGGTAGCDTTHPGTIRIVAEPMHDDGLFVQVEYLQNGNLANSVRLVDRDGDGVVDGKSGPRRTGNWPPGWVWFDSMYEDAAVGQTTISFDGDKVVVTATNMYEFLVGEYVS